VVYAASEVSATDVWAVGVDDINSVGETLVEHWNGTTWTWHPESEPRHRQPAE
jgi:hypothetical protein